MAIKRMQMYRRNLDGTETRLNPLTEAQYVSMENGQTVQEILSDRDSDKYTPVITNSSSTFKVGQGDSVDLSSSMKEGAYDSCVLKGKTMVNCIQEPSSQDVVLPYEFADGQYVTINDTKESGALGIELKGQTLVNLVGEKREYNNSSLYGWEFMLPYKLTKDARYMVVFNASGTITDNSKVYLMDNGFNNNAGNTPHPVTFSLGYNKHITTASGDNHKVLRIRTGSQAVNDFKVSDVMLIPYQEGMENWDIPYFEGMTSCKMPTLHTVGKNLITQSFINTLCNLDNWEGTGAYRNNRKAGELLALFPSNSYVTQVPALTIPANFYPIIYLSYQDESSVSNGHILASGLYNNNTDSEMVCPERQWRFSVNSKNVVVRGYVNKWNQENMNKLKTVMTQNIQMETGTTTTTYEQGKSSILSLPEEVVLRSLPNGVCDTFNTRTGVYTQRIGEITLDGTQNMSSDNNGVYVQIDEMRRFTNYTGHMICDKLPVFATYGHLANVESGVSGYVNSNGYIGQNWIYIKVNNSIDKNDVKGWLSQSPVKIQYELETPIITKINLSSTLKSWNTTTHIYSEIAENTLYPILSHSNPSYPVILKPSTKYSIVANSYSNSHTNSAINFNLGGATTSTTVGNRVTTITTPSTLSNELLTMNGRGNKLNNVMVIEGDVVGDEPYFEGICDCKSPILLNCGKNLFDGEIEAGRWLTYGKLEKYSTVTTGFRSANIITITPSSRYTISGNFKASGYFVFGNKDGYITRYIGLPRSSQSMSFNTNPDECYGVWYTVDIGQTEVNKPTNIQLEEASTATSYEPYKSNILSFNQKDGKTIVLRSLPNGVCDTLNVETGEYVQRIGERTLNGSEDWGVWQQGGDHLAQKTVVGFGLNLDDAPTTKNFYVLCDHFATGGTTSGANNDHTYYVYHKELIYGYYANASTHHRLGLSVSKTKLGIPNDNTNATQALAGLRTYLASNPVTVQYELATPIVSTIDVQGFPYAYTNGHVQLSSGSIEQSLTPKVEYSLSANKTGQINSNTKRVSAHQKQLDDFEAMMLTQMVQSAYDKAILQFDYEMQMMSLGGE